MDADEKAYLLKSLQHDPELQRAFNTLDHFLVGRPPRRPKRMFVYGLALGIVLTGVSAYYRSDIKNWWREVRYNAATNYGLLKTGDNGEGRKICQYVFKTPGVPLCGNGW